MNTHRFIYPIAFIALVGNLRAENTVNSWTQSTSGNWQETASWTLGVLPNATQSILLTNAGFKAVAIGAITAQNFPESLQIQNLAIQSPTNSHNTLLMNFAGLERPLQTTSVSIGADSSVVLLASALTNSGDLLVRGTFSQSDYSVVTAQGGLIVGGIDDGEYYLTNGILNVVGNDHAYAEQIGGGFQGFAKFVQYGGSNNVRNLEVSINGEFDLYGGQIVATNGMLVGIDDYANYATFHHYGGEVRADTDINGNYILDGGQITGHMSVVSPNSYQRVDAFVKQNGGTNAATSFDLGHPNRFGGWAYYVLSNGVIEVASSTTFRGGQFSQYNGRHTIASNLVLQGTDLGLSFGYARADYFLSGGNLAAGGLIIRASTLQQDGGTNSVAGDVVISGPYPQGTPETPRYVLGDGRLAASNVIVSAFFGGFRQIGGTNQVTGQLALQGTNYAGFQYSLEGGTLLVNDLVVSSNAFFNHTNGTIIQSGVLNLHQGGWFAASGDHSLGPLLLTGGPATNSVIVFPAGSSILRLADSSAQPWAANAILQINNWHGAAAGGGATRLYFGTDASGLTTQQLARIQFNLAGQLFPAQILATGEIVPALPPPLSVTRNPDGLILSWSGDYQLFSATNVKGPYTLMLEATSPHTNSVVEPQRFFRLGSTPP